MRPSAFTGLIALSVTALLAGAAAAQTVAPAPAAPGRHARLDTDNDGKISQAEFVQTRTARLAALDADRDGTISADEAQAAKARRATARFDRLDADRNGQISRAEFDAAREHRAEGGRGGRRMARHAARRMGPAGEARLGAAERMARRGPVSIADAQSRANETFARLDANHDGFLTADERRTGRADRMGQARHGREGRRMSRPIAPAATPASPSAPASE